MAAHYSSGIVGIPCCETGRSTAFWECVSQLELPNSDWSVKPERGSSIAKNRNVLIQHARQKGVDYIFFLDDDQLFQPDILRRLLRHEVEVVSGLYCKRLWPNLPLIFDRYEENSGAVVHHPLQQNEKGLKRVPATGAGCLLLRMNIFSQIEEPFFTLGQIDKDQWNDDISFFKKLRAAKVPIYIDLEQQVGHIGEMSIWPKRLPDGTWITVLHNNGVLIQLPKVSVDFSELDDSKLRSISEIEQEPA